MFSNTTREVENEKKRSNVEDATIIFGKWKAAKESAKERRTEGAKRRRIAEAKKRRKSET